MPLLRILRRAIYVILALTLALFAFVQLQQHLLRHRAEKLHAEILALQLHPGTFADIQRMQKEWGRHAHYEGECTQHHCIYNISLFDVASSVERKSSWLQYHWMVVHLLSQPYSCLGGRFEKVSAEIRVRHDVMWGADFSFAISEITHHLDPFNSPAPSQASVEIVYGPRLFSFYPQYSGAGLRRGYTIGVIRGAYARINLTPRIETEAIQNLNTINFKCITRYHPCNNLAELIPKQWDEYSANLAKQNALPNAQATSEADFDDCTPPLSLLALEARNIALVQFLGTNDQKDEVSGLVSSYDRLRTLRYLKNGSAEQSADVREFSIYSHSSQRDSFGAQSGKRFFLFYSRTGRDPSRPHVEQCAIFPDTQKTRKKS